MKNIITKGTETLQNYHYPLAEDNCVIGKIQDVSSSLIRFTKVFDASDTKSYYAIPRYNGKTGVVQAEHLPIVGNFARFYRVGNFNSQGTGGFELRNEDASKSSFLWLADYFVLQEESVEVPKYFAGYDFFYLDGYVAVSGTTWPSTSWTLATLPCSRRANQGSQPKSYLYIQPSSRDTTTYSSDSIAPGYVQRKSHRTGLIPKQYNLAFYTGYSGNGVYTGLITKKTVYWDIQIGVVLPVPRGNQPNKESWIIEEHPYNEPTKSYYCQIEEIMDANSLQLNGTMTFQDYRLTFTGCLPSALDTTTTAKEFVHKDDIFDIVDTNRSINRVDTNAVQIFNNRIQYYDANSTYYYNGTKYTMRKKSRKSGFYNTYGAIQNLPKLGHRQWKLTISTVSTFATYVQVNDNSTSFSMDESFNSDGGQLLIGGIGTGGIIPGTSIVAQYYTTSVIALVFQPTSYSYCQYPLASASWRKWNGVSWVSASLGDSMTTITAGDTWLNVTRISNTITTTVTLI